MTEGDNWPTRERYLEANKEMCWRLALESSTASDAASEGGEVWGSVSAVEGEGRREETERSSIVAVADLGECSEADEV